MLNTDSFRVNFFFDNCPKAKNTECAHISITGSVPEGIQVSDRGISVIRDRVGFSSFYFLSDSTNLYIADKISKIAIARGIQLKVKLDSVCELLSYRYVSGANTLFENIYQVPAGYEYRFFPAIGKWEIVSSRTDRFLFAPNGNNPASKDEFENAFSDIFQDSFQKLEISPTSIFFSGGIDSSLIASLLKPECTGYCAGVNNPQYDESFYAVTAAEEIGISAKVAKISTDNFIKSVRNAVSKAETPLPVIQLSMYDELIRSSQIPKSFIFSGYGADYILGESQRKYWAAIHSGLSIPDWILELSAGLISSCGEKKREQTEKLKTFLSAIKNGQTWNSMLPTLDPPSSQTVSAKALGISSMPDIHAHRRRLLGDENPQYITQQVFITYSNLISATLSSWSSICSSYDLTLKTPFLDRNLVDMITSCKPDLYMSFSSGKPAISNLAGNILPRSLVNRPKKSSLLPPQFWLNMNTPGLRDLIASIRARNMVDIDYLLKREGAFSRYGYIPVWSSINLEILLQHYEANGLTVL